MTVKSTPIASPLRPALLFDVEPEDEQQQPTAPTAWSLSSKYYRPDPELDFDFDLKDIDELPLQSAAAAFSHKHTAAVGAGLSSALCGKATSFTVHGYDDSERPIIAVGLLASVLDVSIKGPSAIKPQMEPLANGSVRVWLKAEVSGNYKIHLKLREATQPHLKPLLGSPFPLGSPFCKHLGSPV